ncbi:MAG: RES family NAD+ phosphorylase [Oceanicaulis sp.]
MPLPAGLRRSELLTPAHGYGSTYVNAAFCYTRPTGNRFNGSDRGAWYAAWGVEMQETAQAEVSWHLTRELENTGVFENVTDYRELIAGFTSRMIDLMGERDSAALSPDTNAGYLAGQELAGEVLRAGYPGILYPSVRHPEGQCLVALRPHIVQNIRQGHTFRFTWSGGPTPEIVRV